MGKPTFSLLHAGALRLCGFFPAFDFFNSFAFCNASKPQVNVASFNVYAESSENHFLVFSNEVAAVSYPSAIDLGDVKKTSSVVLVKLSLGSVIHHTFYRGDYKVAKFRPLSFMFRHCLNPIQKSLFS